MKLTEGLSVQRLDTDDSCPNHCLYPHPEGPLVWYDSMQHHYKECLESGNTLEEAIELMESKNGS